jgi:hypothetical protein
MGSACLRTTLQVPSSGLQTIVARSAYGLISPFRQPWTPNALSAPRRRARESRSWLRSQSRRPGRLCVTMRHAAWGLGNLIPPTHGRAIGVGEARVFSVGEEILHGLRVPFHELVQRQLIELDELIDLAYGCHLEITSIVDAYSFPGHPAIILRYSPNLVGGEFSEVRLDRYATARIVSKRSSPSQRRERPAWIMALTAR